jgi:hypothetical protein
VSRELLRAVFVAQLIVGWIWLAPLLRIECAGMEILLTFFGISAIQLLFMITAGICLALHCEERLVQSRAFNVGLVVVLALGSLGWPGLVVAYADTIERDVSGMPLVVFLVYGGAALLLCAAIALYGCVGPFDRQQGIRGVDERASVHPGAAQASVRSQTTDTRPTRKTIERARSMLAR